jgi:hypothetical protein
MACNIELIELGVTDAQTESLTGRGSPGDDRQILHEKDDYPLSNRLTDCLRASADDRRGTAAIVGERPLRLTAHSGPRARG